MVKSAKILSVFLVACFLFSCATSKDGSVNPSEVIEKENPVMPDYLSDYQPFMSQKLPVIKIQSNSGSTDFADEPVSAGVSKMKMQWGGYKGEPAPYYEACVINVYDENSNPTIVDADAQVKVRGNWTSNYPKKPLRIKFEKKQSMLGLNNNVEMKNWVLQASYKDWSFLRDSTAYYLSHMISPLYTTDCRLVNLYINDKYYGVYLLAEQQEIDKNRINLTKTKENYEGFDLGYLLELDTYWKDSEYHFEIDYLSKLRDCNNQKVSTFMKGYSIKNEINTKKQADFIAKYMNNLWKICYEAVYNKTYYTFNEDKTKLVPSNAKSCYDCISQVIDLESLVDTYLLHEICCDADIGWSSFYMDVDLSENGSKKLRFQAPWDFDSALGNKRFCEDGEGIYAGALNWDVDHRTKDNGNPWFLIFINCSWFRDMISQKWTQLHNQKVETKIQDYITFVSKQYKKDFIANYSIWKNAGQPFTLGGELCTSAASCKNQEDAAEWLSLWLELRFESLNSIWLK